MVILPYKVVSRCDSMTKIILAISEYLNNYWCILRMVTE